MYVLSGTGARCELEKKEKGRFDRMFRAKNAGERKRSDPIQVNSETIGTWVQRGDNGRSYLARQTTRKLERL